MYLYAINPSGKIEEQRTTLTQKNRADGCYLVLAKNPPKDQADAETGAWKIGTKIPDTHVVPPGEILAFLSVPKSHLMNAVAFGKK